MNRQKIQKFISLISSFNFRFLIFFFSNFKHKVILFYIIMKSSYQFTYKPKISSNFAIKPLVQSLVYQW